MSTAQEEPLVPDITAVADDGDSAFEGAASSLTSLRSSVRQYQIENGRTYHGMSSGSYAYPNDEAENERLDLQHNLWLLTLRGELCLSPKGSQGARRVLDCGTGTGIWAIEYADMHPESEVLGVDLSPIQPSLVPPNCSFEIDDLEKDWTWQPFDLIFSRVIVGSLGDYEAFITNAFKNLEPGGYLEMHDVDPHYHCDDGTLKPDSVVFRMSDLACEASAKLGRPLTVMKSFKSIMEKVGFVDVVEKKFKWPLNDWPADKHHKEIGTWFHENISSGLEGLMMALFTRGLGWTPEEVVIICAQMRKAMKDRSMHAYVPAHVIYGRKPEKTPDPKETADEADQTEAAG